MSDVLVLSKTWEPYDRVSWQRAFVLLCGGEDGSKKVEVLEYDDRTVRSGSLKEWRVPSVIRFLEAITPEIRRVKFSRENIYARDGGLCQYCGRRVAPGEFEYEHVIPRAKGVRRFGRTSSSPARFATSAREVGRRRRPRCAFAQFLGVRTRAGGTGASSCRGRQECRRRGEATCAALRIGAPSSRTRTGGNSRSRETLRNALQLAAARGKSCARFFRRALRPSSGGNWRATVGGRQPACYAALPYGSEVRLLRSPLLPLAQMDRALGF